MAGELVYPTSEDIVADMMAVYEAKTGRRVTDLNKYTVFRTLLDIVAEEHQETAYQVSIAALRASLRSATGSDLDAIGADEGLSRKSALGSEGYVRLSKSVVATSDSAVSAPGTIVVSNGIYRYTNAVACRIFTGSTLWVVDDGVNSNPDILFTSIGTGGAANSAPDTVTQIITAPAFVDECTNPEEMSGARAEETDEEFRQRISYERDREKGGSRLALKAEALALTEVFSAEVYEWAITPSGSKYVKPSPGEVWVYISPTFTHSQQFAVGAAVAGYSHQYTLNPSTILDRVRNVLEPVRAFPITVKVFHAYNVLVNVKVDIVLYRAQRLSDTATAEQDLAQRIRSYLLGLKIGEDLSEGHIFSLISEVLTYKSASVTFDVWRNRSHAFVDEDVVGSIEAEADEVLRPYGSFAEFGVINISNEAD